MKQNNILTSLIKKSIRNKEKGLTTAMKQSFDIIKNAKYNIIPKKISNYIIGSFPKKLKINKTDTRRSRKPE